MSDYFKKRKEQLGLTQTQSSNASSGTASTQNNGSYFSNRISELGLDKPKVRKILTLNEENVDEESDFIRQLRQDLRFADFDMNTAQQGLAAYQRMRFEGPTAAERQQKRIEQAAWAPLADAIPDYWREVQQYANDTSWKEPTDKWNDDLRNAFGYLYAKDKEQAFQYAQEINEAINAASKEEKRQAVQGKATSGFWAGTGETAKAIIAGMGGIGDYLNDVAEYTARGKITEKGDMLSPTEYADAVTGGISEKLNEYGTLDEGIPVIGGKGWGDAYGMGVSMATSLLSGHALGRAGSLVQFFGSAAASAVNEAKMRGATDEQALAMGFASGASESLTELIPIDNLLNMGAAADLSGAMWNILKQSGEEFLGEGANSIITTLADNWIMADKSNFATLKQDYMKKGFSEEEAKNEAFWDLWEDVAFDAISGAITGAGSAGVEMGISGVVQNRHYRKAYSDSSAALVRQGLDAPKDSLSHTLAERYQAKLNAGGSLSGAEIRRLAKANEQQYLSAEYNAIRDTASELLTTLGETENVVGIADTIAKKATKQKVSKAEQAAFDHSSFGIWVMDQLAPETFGAEWAFDRIVPMRVVAQDYSARSESLKKGSFIQPHGGILKQQATDNSRKATEVPGNATPELSKVTETEEKSTLGEVIGEPPEIDYKKKTTVGAGADKAEAVAGDASDANDDSQKAGGETAEGKTVLVSTGETVKIARIANVGRNGDMKLELSDGSVVDAADVSHASDDEALLYSTIADLGASAETSNNLLNVYRKDPDGVSPSDYAAGMVEAFTYGQYHIPKNELTQNEAASTLTEVQRNTAYELGRHFGGELVQSKEANIRRAKAAARANEARMAARATGFGAAGKVHFDSQGKTLNDAQETGLKTMEQLSQLFRVEFQVFESYEKDGKRVFRDENGVERGAPNGWYDPETGHIHIDLNAGSGGRGTMLFTVAHELTHYIRDWSPAKFDKLAEAVFELVYKEKNIRVVDLVRKQQAKAARNGMDLSFDEAYEEVVADSMESILASGNVVELMAEIKQQDQSLWQKIRKWFQDLAEDIRKMIDAYAGYKPDSAEGRAVAAMEEMLPVIEGFYADALQEASANYQAAEGQKNTTHEGGDVKYSISYRDAIDQLAEGTLDRKTNTHLLVSENTPQVYIDKAGAKDQKIIMGWDIAYLAMNKGGDAPGNYHGLGKEVMKNLPEALKDPLYVVKQNNGRVAAVTEIVVKKNRSVVVSVEFDAFKSTIQDGEAASDNYNIIVTALDAKPNYLQNTILSGNIVHNKNNENPANFILRLKSLNKALPNDDLARSSKTSIRNAEPEVKKKFSARDSNGAELTDAQAEYFRDSKVRDADGNLLVMYHGTPNGGFTKFRSGSYFTQNPEYAAAYQNPNASSLSVKRNADNRQNYKVYLNITNPFDTRNQRERRIFMQEYYRQWGTGAPLTDSGLPDWTDGMDLQEFIEEMGYDYDGLILDEGATGGYGEEVKSRGLSYVTFSPEQVKNVDNQNPTDNPDIRYSQRDPLQEKVIQALKKENAQLKEDVKGLKDMVKLQKKLTGGKLVKISSVEAAARMLKKSTDATGDTRELVKLLGEFYAYIANGEELTWEGVQEAAQGAADWLWNNRKQTTDEYSVEILRDLRTRGVSFNEDQKSEAAVTHDTFANYRKALFGSVKISENGMPLDEAWRELSGLYPEVFPEDTNSGDMPRALVDIVARLRSSDGTYMGYDEIMARQSLIRDVYDSYWNVSTLYTVADVKQKEINALKSRHAQRMSDLRTKHREKVEQLHLEQRAAVEAVRAAERKRSQEKTRKALDKHRENQKQVAANRAERREKTEVRRKIRKAVMELDKLLNRGDKKKNVKNGMSEMVSKSLKLAEALFMDEYSNRDMLRNGVGIQMTDAEEKLFQEAQQLMESIESGAVIEGMEFDGEIDAMEQMKKLDGKLSGKMAKLKDVFARERKHLYSTTVSELLGQLADEYSRLSEAEDGAIRAAKDENVYAHLLQLQKDVGGTTVRDMNLNQLEQVADAYTMVLTTVRNANKMFAKNLKFKRDTLAGMVMGEIGAATKKVSKLVSPGKDATDKFSWNNLKPVYAFERLGSQTLKTLFGNIRKGQDVWAVDIQEADAFRRDQYKKHKRKDWDMEKQYSFEFESGKVDLSLEQIMSLYAYSRREAALDHLLKGGFVFGGSTEVSVKKNGIKRRYLKKDATAYNLSATELMQVIDSLTKEQKAFVEEMQTYLSDVMGGKGNEVSMQMYGIKSFSEKNYFPLRSAGQYMEKAKEDSFQKEQGQISIVNSGFTKATTPHASNPITLDGFMDVWSEHVNDMAMYHGFVFPMEDFRRVYNYSTPNVEEGNSQSVNAAIENAFGKAATDYIDQMYKDLNGGVKMDSTVGVINKGIATFKKGAVFASASVVVQQPSAIARAAALVDLRYFIGPKVDHKRHKLLWEEVKKYAPVAFVKEMGYFDTGMGRNAKDYLQAEGYSGIQEKVVALVKDADYRDEILGKAPALADELSWCSIWEAVKRETKARNPGMDTKSDVFLKLAGERFSEVIDKTQVYDSVLSRSANMRSKDTGMKMATAFMAEPTVAINMIEDALRKGKQGGKEGRRYCRRAIGSVIAAQILNSFLVSWVYAARDDDDDESYLEKYLSSFASGIMDGLNPATYIPFLKDIISIVQGYDIERSDMAVISDLWSAYQNLGKENVPAWRKVEGFVGSICQIFGLPVKNIMRDVRASYQAYDTLVNGEKTTKTGLWYAISGASMSNPQQLYKARMDGDKEHAARVEARYDDEDSANAAVRSAIRERFLAGEIDAATALKHMVQFAGMDANEAHWLMNEWEYRKATGSDDGYSKFNDFYTAVETGKNLKAVIKEYTDNGVQVSTLNQMITVNYKPMYTDMSKSGRANIKGYLINALEQCGISREDAKKKLDDWDFETEYGFSYDDRKEAYLSGRVSAAELRSILIKKGFTAESADSQIEAYEWENAGLAGATIDAIQDYNTWCKSEGVSKEDYFYIRKFSNNTKNDIDENGRTVNYSAMKKVMAEIDKLSLSDDQKTAIARSMGWSEKNIKKYKPW